MSELTGIAKELYDALDLVIQEIVGENYDDEEGICEAARRVLAKARGEQQ